MPYQDPDPVDPLTLHGVMFEVDGTEAVREMAECFIEEYFRLGFDPERIMKLFRTKGYAGPHLALRVLGEPVILDLVESLARRWGPRPAGAGLAINGRGDVMLPVLTTH